MALLRGNSDSSWVMHWTNGSSGRLWLSEPLDDSTAAHKVPIDIGDSLNTFCAGQAVLPDGRLMVVGGTVVGVTGETRAPIFDPKNFGDASHGWTSKVPPDTVEYGRWYPTVTALGDGTMLTTSGFDFLNMQMFGGSRDSSGTNVLKNDFRLLNLRKWPRWEDDRPELANRPSPRSGHTAVFWYDAGRTVLFGGLRDSAGLKIPTNDVRLMFIRNTQEGHDWEWQDRPVVGDSTIGAAFPLPRHRHAAVIVDNVMVIYGGIGRTAAGQDTVLSDVWRLILDPTNAKHRWKRDVVSGGPGARYGHTAVIDADEDNGQTPAMVIYGGRSAVNGTFAGEKAWYLSLDRVDSLGAGR